MITVHHLENSRSQRVLWLLEELGVPYEIVRYERDRTTMLAPPSLRGVHPLGKSPVITDGENTVAESGAIVEYLLERYGQGRFVPAPGSADHLRSRYFMHYAEGSAMPLLLLKLIFDRLATSPVPFFVRPIVRGIAKKMKDLLVTRQLAEHMAFLEHELKQKPWFTGDLFGAADIQMSFPVEAAKQRGGITPQHPLLLAYLTTIHARPAYQRALERGGPYAFAD